MRDTVLAVNRKRAIKSLIVSRMTFGIAVWLFPRPVGKAFGLDMPGNPQIPYLGRILGTRDITLAFGLMATEGDAQQQWLVAGFASDCADVVAALAGGVGGYLPKRTSAILTAAALAPMVRGAIALRER
jgi:DNA-binding NarL/FixJ family response regulator